MATLTLEVQAEPDVIWTHKPHLKLMGEKEQLNNKLELAPFYRDPRNVTTLAFWPLPLICGHTYCPASGMYDV